MIWALIKMSKKAPTQNYAMMAYEQQFQVDLPVPSHQPVTSGLIEAMLLENQSLLLKSFEEQSNPAKLL